MQLNYFSSAIKVIMQMNFCHTNFIVRSWILRSILLHLILIYSIRILSYKFLVLVWAIAFAHLNLWYEQDHWFLLLLHFLSFWEFTNSLDKLPIYSSWFLTQLDQFILFRFSSRFRWFHWGSILQNLLVSFWALWTSIYFLCNFFVFLWSFLLCILWSICSLWSALSVPCDALTCLVLGIIVGK